jgi:polysaccharide biosynthesis transport protein
MNMLANPMNGAASAIAEPPVPGVAPTAALPVTPFIQHYIQIAVRRRWLILGIASVAILLGVIITLLMTPQYTAKSTIEIQRNTAQVTEFEGVEREQGIGDQEFYQTQYGLLQARTLAERVANQLNLVNRPVLFEIYDIKPEGPAFEEVGGRYPADGFAARQRAAGEILLEHVTINPTRLSRLVEIQFTSPDPEFSALVANAWAQNFIQTNLDRKVQATSYGREQLQRQLGEYKQRLDESQRQLVDYASREQIINLPSQATGDGSQTQERSIVADDLTALNSALLEATADRIRAQARAQNSGRAGASVEALTNPAINDMRRQRALLESEYQQLLQRFEPEYPAAQAVKSQIDQLDRSLAREEGRVGQSVNAEYRAALQREQALQSRVNELKSTYLDTRRRLIQYNIFQQEVDTNRALYDGLLQRFKEIGIAGGVGVNNISIVDPADVPQGPSSPSLILNLLLSTLLGLGLGVIVALILEQLNEAITDPAEVERRLGLPLLGVVPKSEEEEPREALLDRKSDLIEGYLSVQTNLSFTTEHGVPRSLMVTSTRPAEGKSTTALALATTLSRGQKRVVLVDGDMRSPSVHQLAGVSHDIGLSNFLSGQDDVDSLLFKVGEFGFDAMTAGPIPPNAAELLTGTRLPLLIERLLQRYDHVIIDSPPVLGLADAPLIASKVEGVVYAVESHKMRSSMARTALGRLISANAHILGIVLTKFEGRRSQYSYNYSYDYGMKSSQPTAAA